MVGQGDTTSKIAAMFGVSEKDLANLNFIQGDPTPEQIIKIPTVPPGKLNWPFAGKLLPMSDNSLRFGDFGAAVWADGFGQVTVTKKRPDAAKEPPLKVGKLKIPSDYQVYLGGYDVRIDHHNGFVSEFLGLDAVTTESGDFVDPNTLLGSVGVDFEFRVLKDGEAINPLSVLSQPDETINKD
nr:LysM peptidoglycan-binding domain-containing M23 family metallopeptidase [Rhizobium leguminosarum]